MAGIDETTPDSALLAAILAGQDEGFAELMRRYQRPLWRVARSRLGRDDWADDVVQETFFCVLRWLPSYDSRYSFRTWLWTILLNQCHRQWRKGSRGLLFGLGIELGGDDRSPSSVSAAMARQLRSPDNPSHALEAKERIALLDALLTRLPEPQADALRLRFFAGLKFAEIADTMGCSLSTAKNRVRWGLLKLAEFLGPSGEFASWGLALGEERDEESH
jgi:RNA polymerase sigma-70 factor, ECF subfamily